MSEERMFRRYIGIDYSGADRPTRRIAGLAVCSVDGCGHHEFPNPLKPGVRNWNRWDVAKWLVKRLKERDTPTLVGIDHAFSFPIEYFRKYALPEVDWSGFLGDFREHWPTHKQRVVDLRGGQRRRNAVDEDRAEEERKNDHRCGEPQWKRLTDIRAPGAQSVFDFDVVPVQSQVATSTHAGLPWLLYIREELEKADVEVHFWPFDGWEVPERRSAVVEVYPALWHPLFRNETAALRDNHRRDAYSVARWMSEQAQNNLLSGYFNPGVPDTHKDRARTEGWILGVM